MKKYAFKFFLLFCPISILLGATNMIFAQAENIERNSIQSAAGEYIPFAVRVNFQPDDAETPAGFVKDSGKPYALRDNGYRYGWNADISSNARDRNNPTAYSQAYDTIIRTQEGGNYRWEIEVPNGYYQVRLVAGDPSFTDSQYRFNVEGFGDVLKGTPTTYQRWFEAVDTFYVSDGKLTVYNDGFAVNNKLAFVEITRKFGLKVNFQPSYSSPIESQGYVSDNGYVYGDRSNGFIYGWNADNTVNMRDRSYDIDILLQRLAHMQKGGDFSWEIAVPDGVYDVFVVAGDPIFSNSIYRIEAEDALVVSGSPEANGFVSGTTLTAVKDGRLTLKNAPGSFNNKINYVTLIQR